MFCNDQIWEDHQASSHHCQLGCISGSPYKITQSRPLSFGKRDIKVS